MSSRRHIRQLERDSPPELPENHIEDATSFLENTRAVLRHVRGEVAEGSALDTTVHELGEGLRHLSQLLSAEWIDSEAIAEQLKRLKEIYSEEVRLSLENLIGRGNVVFLPH